MVTKQDSGRATIGEIAREAGVSVPTVSKVLNGHAHVAAATRARVEEIIAKRDYARRPAKRSKKAGLVDLVFPGMASEWACEIIEGVERVARGSRIRHGGQQPVHWTDHGFGRGWRTSPSGSPTA